MQQNRTIIQGDLRVYLKQLEAKEMLDSWKISSPKQSQWVTQHQTQILHQANRVWKWSIERGEGAAWIYYIFAISQWLPTNHRTQYGDQSGYDREKCKLCLLDQVENMDHLLVCPALLHERSHLLTSVNEKLSFWKIPYASKQIETLDSRRCRKWFQTARTIFPSETNSQNTSDTIS